MSVSEGLSVGVMRVCGNMPVSESVRANICEKGL